MNVTELHSSVYVGYVAELPWRPRVWSFVFRKNLPPTRFADIMSLTLTIVHASSAFFRCRLVPNPVPNPAPDAAPVAAPTGDEDFIYIGCFSIGENEVFNFDEIEGTDDLTPTVSRVLHHRCALCLTLCETTSF